MSKPVKSRKRIIWEILADVYENGKPRRGTMAEMVATDLDEKWDDIKAEGEKYRDGFHRALANRIWVSYSGGSTADHTATKIIEQLGTQA